MPIVCGYAMTVILPLIDDFRGQAQIPFQTKPMKMVLICSFVVPAWHGAYAVYIQHHKPAIIEVIVSDQGAGFSFPPLVSNIDTERGETYLWFYGHTLLLGHTQRYIITLLPYSNIMISASPCLTNSRLTN
jgi:hypothetical protein